MAEQHQEHVEHYVGATYGMPTGTQATFARNFFLPATAKSCFGIV
jgi:hypothetical protein